MKIKTSIITAAMLTIYANALDLNSVLKTGQELVEGSSSSTGTSLQTDGLKEALNIGVDFAVKSLSNTGYLDNANVKIPLPGGLDTVANMAKKAGGEKYVNDLVKDMNLAAGEAVKNATPIFSKAITNMNVQDANALINGGENSITKYFQTKTSTDLTQMMLPIVKKATSNNSLASSYKALMNAVGGGSIPGSELLGQAKGVASAFGVDMDGAEDLDGYVTKKAVSGVFYMIAKEEAKIRENPLSYSSDLIKQVFK